MPDGQSTLSRAPSKRRGRALVTRSHPLRQHSAPTSVEVDDDPRECVRASLFRLRPTPSRAHGGGSAGERRPRRGALRPASRRRRPRLSGHRDRGGRSGVGVFEVTISILFGTRFLPMIPRSVVAATKLVRVGRGRGARLERPRGITPVLLPALEAAGRSILAFGGALARLASTFVALRLHHRRFPQRIGFAAHVLTGAGPPVGVPPLVSWLAPTPACALASPGSVDRPRGQGVSRPGPGPVQQRERRRTGTKARFAVPG